MTSCSRSACNRSETIISFHEAINRQMPIPNIERKVSGLSEEKMEEEV